MRYADAARTAIRRDSDGAMIPTDPANTDYAALVASGAEIAPYEPPPAPPVTVTQWQAREALRLAGKLAAVNAFIAGLGEEHEAYVAWHYRDVIASNSPLIAALAPALGLTEAELDALFTTARSL